MSERPTENAASEPPGVQPPDLDLPELGPPELDPGMESRYRPDELVDGRYRLTEIIGRGGSGEVWIAEHVHLKTEVAIKLFIEAPHADEEGSAHALDRFRFEAQVSALLGSRTRHIVQVHDAGQEQSGPFLVMERVKGCALDLLIEDAGPLSPARTLALLEPIGDVIDMAHAEGIVHRDLKPANILVCSTDHGEVAKLADFGIAKSVSNRLSLSSPKQTAQGIVVGTPDYMSPEQVAGQPITPTVDVWALAVVAYECLSGMVPFSAPTHVQTMLKVATASFARPSTVRADLPAGIDGWFDRALHKDPTQRFRNGKEMFRALRAVLEGPVPLRATAPAVSAPPEVLRPSLPIAREAPPPPTSAASPGMGTNDSALVFTPPPTSEVPRAGAPRWLRLAAMAGICLFVVAATLALSSSWRAGRPIGAAAASREDLHETASTNASPPAVSPAAAPSSSPSALDQGAATPPTSSVTSSASALEAGSSKATPVIKRPRAPRPKATDGDASSVF